MTPSQIIALCASLCLGWGAIAASIGLPWYFAAAGGCLIYLLWVPGLINAYSRQNRGESS